MRAHNRNKFRVTAIIRTVDSNARDIETSIKKALSEAGVVGELVDLSIQPIVHNSALDLDTMLRRSVSQFKYRQKRGKERREENENQ